ncbi:hypothetical protein REPUB_Repub03eG0249800 [Reevesia pubescens]
MTRGKQKIEAQRRNAERNQKPNGSQLEARAVALKASCPICKFFFTILLTFYTTAVACELILLLYSIANRPALHYDQPNNHLHILRILQI